MWLESGRQKNIAYAQLMIIHLTHSPSVYFQLENVKQMRENQQVSFTIYEDILEIDCCRVCLMILGRHWWCHLPYRCFFTYLSVCHLFPGSSRVRLCRRPQGTQGLSALHLGALPVSQIFSVQFGGNKAVLTFFSQGTPGLVGPEGLAGEPGKPGYAGPPGVGKPGPPVSVFL